MLCTLYKFKSWAYALHATTKGKNPRMAESMKKAEDQSNADEDFEDEAFNDELGNVQKSILAHGILLNMVVLESEPLKKLENNDGKGLGCWPLFHRGWNRHRPLSSIDVAEAIRKIERAKFVEDVYPRLQDHHKLVTEWTLARRTAYHEVDLKADDLRIIPEKWV